MKERPILFSGPMVRAILAGRKTQTRRVVAPRNSTVNGSHWAAEHWSKLDFSAECYLDGSPTGCTIMGNGQYFKVPRPSDETRHRVRSVIEPGDRLWVREAWCPTLDLSQCEGPNDVTFRATADEADECLCDWRSPIFMPRWASRLALEVVAVRVELLQEISRADAAAEGMCYLAEQNAPGIVPSNWPEQNFAAGWNTINGKRAPWASNPWVWVVEFKVAS